MEVTAPPGTPIGSIQQEWSIFKPKFSVKDASGETVLMIEGPLCTFSMCGDVEFNVLSRDGSTKVGKISKQWSGFVREAFTDADMFGINFPLDLDVKMKAVMLGACFLIVITHHLASVFTPHLFFIVLFLLFFNRISCSSKRPAMRNATDRGCFKFFTTAI